jgi:hypothetical protein
MSALVFAIGLQPAPRRLLVYTDPMNTVDIFHSLEARGEYNHRPMFAMRLLLPQTTSLHVFHIAGSCKGNLGRRSTLKRRTGEGGSKEKTLGSPSPASY